MTERFPPDCSPVSGRFRNTTFICFGPSAASLALRAHSRGLRPPVLVLRLLRWRSALTRRLACARFAPRVTSPRCAVSGSFGCFAGASRLGSLARLLRSACALATGLSPCLAPSAAPLRALRATLRASGHLARLLRYAARSRARDRAPSPCLAPSTAPLSFSEHVRARFHKRRACATLAGAAAHGFSCPLHPFLTCL